MKLQNPGVQNQVMKENQIILPCEEIMNQTDTKQSPYSTGDENGCMIAKIHCSLVDDFDDNADIIRACVAPSNKKSTESYVDKGVLECQLSKTAVYYKDINVNNVKDICIDEGVSSPENILFATRDEKSICTILPSVEDQNESFIKEQENSSEVWKLIADDLTFSDLGRDWTTTCDNSTDLTQIVEAKLIKSGESANSENPTPVSTAVEPPNGNSALDSAVELPNESNLTNALAYNSEVENGSITFNFDSSPHVADGGEECHGDANLNCSAPMAKPAVTEECCQSKDSAVETQVSTNLETGTFDPRLVSSQTQQDFGESSFSVVDPLASLMNYSGPIAYSGNLSLRSESSAASTRSFAFPILHSEWNSSPVKMVKAERRHYRKYRGWREGLLCCKF